MGEEVVTIKTAHQAICHLLDVTDEWVRRVSYEGSHHKKREQCSRARQ